MYKHKQLLTDKSLRFFYKKKRKAIKQEPTQFANESIEWSVLK